jgi:transcriptional regulator with XRE-family HTH domain
MPKSVNIENFAAKLDLLCKRLNWSRGKLAQQVAIDKSLASRWVSGSSRPTGNTLMRLNDAFAKVLPGFGADSWDLDVADLARRFGIAAPLSKPASIDHGGARTAPGLPMRSLERFADEIDIFAPLYEGFYNQWFCHPSNNGTICRRRARIVRRGNRLIGLASGVSFDYESNCFVSGDRLYAIGESPRFSGPIFCIFTGTTTARMPLMAGMGLFQSNNAGMHGVVSLPIAFEFVALHSGDDETDAGTWAGMTAIARDFPAGHQREVPAPILKVMRTLTDAEAPNHVVLIRPPV